jgi:hypothetical protein
MKFRHFFPIFLPSEKILHVDNIFVIQLTIATPATEFLAQQALL